MGGEGLVTKCDTRNYKEGFQDLFGLRKIGVPLDPPEAAR